MEERYVTLGHLAKLLGPGWTRSTVWYWLGKAEVTTFVVPGLPYRYVPASTVTEALHRLRAARAARQHDGHGQHGRPRRRAPAEEEAIT